MVFSVASFRHLHPFTSAHDVPRNARSSLSCRAKLPSCLMPKASGASNLSMEFFRAVQQSLRIPCAKARHRCVTMMPLGSPQVQYLAPGQTRSQWVDLWDALYRERVVYVGQEIDESFSNNLLASMLFLDYIDTKRLIMYIISPGGDITPSLALYDTVRSLKSPVVTICMGFAQGMAAFLLAAGVKGRRAAMPKAVITLLSPAGVARGQADDIENEANELLRIRDYLCNELSEHTGQPAEKICKDLRRPKWFSSKEALDYGLIDRIIRPARARAASQGRDLAPLLE